MSLANTLNKMTKQSSFEEAFVNSLKNQIKSQNTGNRPISKTYKPSWLGGCRRKQVFLFLNQPQDRVKTQSPEMWMMGQSGSKDHKTIQELIIAAKDWGIEWVDPAIILSRAKEIGINTEINVRQFKDDPYELLGYNKDYNISFKTDGFVIFQNKLVIFEFKTEDYFKFQKRFAPAPDHKVQSIGYSLCTGIDYVLFLYQDRNYKVFKPYLIEITDEDRASVVDYIKECNYCIDNRIIPPLELDKCQYCMFTSVCKKIGNWTGKLEDTSMEV